MGILLLGLALAVVPSAAPTTALPGENLVPTALAISPIPPNLPADNNTYPAVVVSVLDSGGRPTVALSPINVSLTSSEENVGSVAPTVTIESGETYAIANFTTTHTPGQTTITAITTGLSTASTVVSTVVSVGYPTHLVITAVPATVPAQPANIGKLILELQDDVGLPAKAISNTPISLYSSNINVVNVTSANATMKQGQYLEELNYTSGFVPGSATITASAGGFSSGSATVTVSGSPPLALRLIAQPSTVVACTSNVTSCSGRLVVALTDLNGNPTIAPRDIQVQIRSSDLAAVNASETTTIDAGNISATATYLVTATSVGPDGAGAVITASAPGLSSGFAQISVVPPSFVSPAACTKGGGSCSLAIFAGPDPVLADHRSYSSVVVSLQATVPGVTGGPAAVNATGPTEVTLTSSVTGVGNFTRITFTIPEGQNWAAVTFTSTFQVGQTQLTASAENMLSAQTDLGTYGSVPSNVVVSAISPTLPADGQTHPALELSLQDAFGSPAIAPFDVPVSLSSSESEIVNVSPAVIPSGESYAIVNVTAGILQGKANVTALVASFTSGYTTSSVDLSTVIPAPSALAALAPDGGTVMFTPGSGHSLPIMAIQLQDSSGNPARARAPMNVTISSSNSTVISKVLSAVIGVGQDYVTVPLVARVPGETTLTLSTPGLTVASTTVTFLSYPSSETLTGGPPSIFTNETSVLSVTVSLDGSPLQDAAVYWRASSGGLTLVAPTLPTSSSSSTTTSSSSGAKGAKAATPAGPAPVPSINATTGTDGTSTAVFHPGAAGKILITALVAPGGLLSQTLNFTVTVKVAPQAVHLVKAKATLVKQLTTFPMVLLPAGGAGGAVAAVVVVRRRKGGGGSSEEEFDTSLE